MRLAHDRDQGAAIDAGTATSRFTDKDQATRGLRQDASEQQAERRTAPGNRGEDAKGLLTVLGVLEGQHQERQRRGGKQGAEHPWSARAPMSTAKDWTKPPIAEATANPASPATNVHLQPNRSPSLPPSSSRLPNNRA